MLRFHISSRAAAVVLATARCMDVRKAQDPERNFGVGPTPAVAAFRQVKLLRLAEGAERPGGLTACGFMKSTPAATFYPPMPAGAVVAPVKW